MKNEKLQKGQSKGQNNTGKKCYDFLNHIIEVPKINDAPLYRLCYSYEYSQFIPNKSNRDGRQDKRVQTFVNKINADRFYGDLGHVAVGRDRVLREGHHRYYGSVETGMPIVYMVTLNHSTDVISDFNSCKSSSWNNQDNFGSALTDGAPLAVALGVIRMKLISEYGLKERDLNVGDMYAILTQQTKYFGAGVNAITRGMYRDEVLADKARSFDYLSAIDNYAFIRGYFLYEDTNNKAYKIAKVVMRCSFLNERIVDGVFDLSTFRKNLESGVRFDDGDGSTDDFVYGAVKVHNYRARIAKVRN
jgi:hypothetical protein